MGLVNSIISYKSDKFHPAHPHDPILLYVQEIV